MYCFFVVLPAIPAHFFS